MDLQEIMKGGGYFRIKVITKQSRLELRGVMDDGTIKIALTKPREKGKANKELIQFLSKELSISRDQITIASGLTSPLKVVSIELN